MSSVAKRHTGDSGLSRRTFLAATGVAILGTSRISDSDSTLQSAVLQTVPVLSLTDLHVMGAERYVPWTVDPETAPLLVHVSQAVSDVLLEQVQATAFVAYTGAMVPRFVETAALPISRRAFIPTAGATAAWIETGFQSAEVTLVAVKDGIEWRIDGEDHWQDVIRLRHVRDWLLVTTVGGLKSARFTPKAAVEEYDGILVERATMATTQEDPI